jgi:phage gpG-like protein
MESLDVLLSRFKKDAAAAKAAIAKLPRIIGNEAVRSIRGNFAIEGYYDGNSFKQWAERKPSTNKQYDRRGNYKGSVFNSDNPILKQTGNLRDSVKYKATDKLVRVGTDLDIIPYAQAHNEGIGKQPKRQFMPTRGEGLNEDMRKKAYYKFDGEITKALMDIKI